MADNIASERSCGTLSHALSRLVTEVDTSLTGRSGTTSLRIAIIADVDPFNVPVIRALRENCRVERILTAAPPSAHHRLGVKHMRKPVNTALNAGRGVVFEMLDRRLKREVERALPPGSSPFLGVEPLSPAELKSERTGQLLREMQPDLLFLSGAPILPKEIFTIPRLGTVNLHWGLSTRYRGTHTIFYPLYRQEFDSIGTTLHYVDVGIDTGLAIAEARPALTPSDTLADVWFKTAMASAAIVARFVRTVADRPVPGSPLKERGVLVHNRDRRIWHHVHYAFGRRFLGHRPLSSAGGVVWHGDGAS